MPSGSVSTNAPAAGQLPVRHKGRRPNPQNGVNGKLRKRRELFVVHGRDEQVRERFFELFRAVDLRPMEWEEVVRATGNPAPSLLQAVQTGLDVAQAIVVLLTPDDEVRLHPALQDEDGITGERLAMQARPNVLVELGLALGLCPDRTIIVQVGKLRPVNDLGGLNSVNFDGGDAVGKLVQRLKVAGCPVNDSGADWQNPRRFADLDAYGRGPS
jgi:predicted nucleotide-binding protein